jgi:hypothetical protein
MAIAHVVSTSATPGINGGTTSGIDTTGADALFVVLSYYSGLSPDPVVTDNKGNGTFSELTAYESNDRGVQIFYKANATVGSGHTFTCSSGAIFAPLVKVHAFSGVHLSAPFDVENGAFTASGTSLAPGSITPTGSGRLVISGLCVNDQTGPISENASMTESTTVAVVGTNLGGGTGWIIQGGASAINPVWSWTDSGIAASATIASFKPAVAPGGGFNALMIAP